MEVHHPHHPTHKKKWKEYLLEFFMLFLAVSLGFVAENIREEQVIKHQTGIVLSQLRAELKVDTGAITNAKYFQGRFDTATEFVSYYIRKNQLKGNEKNFYILNNYLTLRAGMFETSCIAINQLKNAGLLKNIREREGSEAREGCNNIKVKLIGSNVFIPDNLNMNSFNQNDYLNEIQFLGLIKNSTIKLYFDTAYNRAARLIEALDKYYPHTSE